MGVKTEGYYTPGNPKRDRTPSRDWVRRAVEKGYTQEQWIKKFKEELEFKDQFDTLVKLQPKEIKGETGINIRLVVEGIKEKQAIPGRIIESLPAHKDQD